MTGTRFGISGLLLAGVLAAGSLAQAAEPIRIGDINSYQRMPAFTEPYKKGLMLAVEEINAAGGIDGRPIEVISRDDDGKPGTAVRLADELFVKEEVALITGSFFSHVGLALASYAGQKERLYLAAEPLADALVWEKGNRYTFRLRPSTYMQAAMLAEEAAKTDAVRWATIAPNYAYGKDAVAAFQTVLSQLKPEVEFVGEQWPALFKIDAGAEVQALQRVEPDGIYNVTFGSDLAKFVREGQLRGLFEDRVVASLLTGEPEYLDPLRDEAPEDWIVTGYPWEQIDTPEHKAFLEAYQARWDDYPRVGSIVGYNTMLVIIGTLKEAGSTDTEALVEAMSGLQVDTPLGPVVMRDIDNQSTMGAYVGRTAVEDGKGVMVDWRYAPGENYLPKDETVRARRPQN